MLDIVAERAAVAAFELYPAAYASAGPADGTFGDLSRERFAKCDELVALFVTDRIERDPRGIWSQPEVSLVGIDGESHVRTRMFPCTTTSPWPEVWRQASVL